MRPCRFEFPWFQSLAEKRGGQIAFLGVNSNDSDDSAKQFLSELPLPYPSYSDPDLNIAQGLGGPPQAFPPPPSTTAPESRSSTTRVSTRMSRSWSRTSTGTRDNGLMTELAIALLAVALLSLIAEAHAPTTVLGLLGVVALVGAGFAWRDAGHDLPVAAIAIAGVILAAFIIFASRKAAAAQRDEPVRTGSEELVGAVAEVREPLDRRVRCSSPAPSGRRERATGLRSA